MSLNDCPHARARHGRFSLTSAPCGRCGRQWVLRGCLMDGGRREVEAIRDCGFHLLCACGAIVVIPVPPFLDQLSIRVVGPARRAAPRARPAA